MLLLTNYSKHHGQSAITPLLNMGNGHCTWLWEIVFCYCSRLVGNFTASHFRVLSGPIKSLPAATDYCTRGYEARICACAVHYPYCSCCQDIYIPSLQVRRVICTIRLAIDTVPIAHVGVPVLYSEWCCRKPSIAEGTAGHCGRKSVHVPLRHTRLFFCSVCQGPAVSSSM